MTGAPCAVGVTRSPVGYGGLWVAGVPRPDHGDGMTQLVCDVCAAGWVGLPGEPCGWCEDRYRRAVADERRRLLRPDWLGGCDSQRYDELADDDKAVWDRTRGQRRGADAVREWVGQLVGAARRGVLTKDEAELAILRVTGRREGRSA